MTPGISHAARIRAYVAAGVLSCCLIGVGVRAWALQVSQGEHFREIAEKQHAMEVEVPAPRGPIVDRAGRPLAVTADVDSVWANPREIRDVTGSAETLAALLGLDAPTLEAKLAEDHHFVWLRRHVTGTVAEAVAAAIKARRLPGVYLTQEPRRWYPGKALAATLLGRADIDGRGVEGIELSLDQALTGKRGAIGALRDAHGRAALDEGIAPSEPGATVELTIDRTIQELTERALADAVTTHRAKSGMAVVMDVQTGQVLALANVPTFDPNATGAHDGARDRAVTDSFEIGSLMKIFSIGSALDAGVVTPDTSFDAEGGAWRFAGRTIHDAHAETELSVAGVFKHSSNIGAAKIALRLGKDRLYDGLRRFGFGGKTGIELPGETAGLVRKSATWRDIELATISYGLGIMVTPLQVAAGVAAIGNGGMYHAPRIIRRIVAADGHQLPTAASEPRRVISAKTAAQLLTMMRSVFDTGKHGGTAGGVVVPGFACGGKTGTAHKYDPATHKYADHRYLSSFAGLAPIDNPRLAIIIVVDDPEGDDHFGGKVAAPAFAIIASESLRYLGVPGQALPPPTLLSGQKPATTSAVAAADDSVADDDAPVADDDGPVSADVADDAQLSSLHATGAIDDPGLTLTVPDLTGFGVGKLLDLARTQHLQLQLSGAGRVVNQDPPPGRYAPGTSIAVTLADPARPPAPHALPAPHN